jgi:hypothetical protein
LSEIPDAAFLAGREDFTFFLTIKEIVVVLHAHEFRPSVLLSDMLEAQELVGKHG